MVLDVCSLLDASSVYSRHAIHLGSLSLRRSVTKSRSPNTVPSTIRRPHQTADEESTEHIDGAEEFGIPSLYPNRPCLAARSRGSSPLRPPVDQSVLSVSAVSSYGTGLPSLGFFGQASVSLNVIAPEPRPCFHAHLGVRVGRRCHFDVDRFGSGGRTVAVGLAVVDPDVWSHEPSVASGEVQFRADRCTHLAHVLTGSTSPSRAAAHQTVGPSPVRTL